MLNSSAGSPRLLPVIDLLDGIVVLGVQGRRETYQPLRSPLVDSADPLAVADALGQAAGSAELYVADLDALTSAARPDWAVLDSLASAGHALWVDAGLVRAEQGQELLARYPEARWIVPLECAHRLDDLLPLFAIAPERTVFSLDLRDGEPVMATACPMEPATIVQHVVAAGCRSLIVLDVAAVGASSGPVTTPLCRQLRDAYPHLELTAGGGVRTR